MKKFAKWLVMVFVVSCLCGLILTMTGCGDKEPTIKSINVDNGKLVAIYDDDTTKDLGVLSNIVSAKEENGNLVITLVDGKEITVNTAGIAGKYVVGVSTANGKIVIAYNDNTTSTIDLPTTATCEHKEAYYEILKEHKIEKDEEGNFNCVEPGFVIMMCPDCGEVKYIKTTEHRIEKNVVAPTCTEKGYTIEKCLYCDYGAGDSEKTDFTDEIPHDFGEPVKVKDEGCEAPYQTLKICKVCGHPEAEVQPAPGHEIVIDKDTLKVPSNTEEGSVVGNCDHCDYTIKFTLPVLGDEKYTSTPVGEKERCDELGKVKYSIELTAGDLKKVTVPFEFEVNGVAGKHVFLDKEVDLAKTLILTEDELKAGDILMLNGAKLTCDESVEAYAAFTCEKCGLKGITVRVAKEHEEDTEVPHTNVVDATCASEGSYTYTCKGCKKNDLVEKTAKKAHEYSLHQNLTEMNDGTWTFTAECGNKGCDATVEGHYISKPGITGVETIKADCQHDGEIVGMVDGKEIRIKTKNKTDHIIAEVKGEYVEATPEKVLSYADFKDYIDMILNGKLDEMTCSNTVEGVYTCAVCGQKGNTVLLRGEHTIPKKADGTDDVEVHPATCTEQGYTSFICANGCSEEPIKYDFVDALGHDYTYTYNKEDGKKLHVSCKRNCGYSNTIECDDVKIERVDSTCKDKGSITYKCYVGDELKTTVTEELPLLTTHFHKVDGKDVAVIGTKDAPLMITDADKEWIEFFLNGREKLLCVDGEDVEAVFQCSICGEHPTVYVKADHVRTGDKSTPATCTEDGHKEFKCSRCNAEFNETEPKLGHNYSVVLKYVEGKVMAYKTCTRCSDSKEEDTEIKLTENLLVTDECVAATCKDTGLNVYKVTYEGKEYTISVTVPKTTEHQKEGDVITWTIDDTVDGKAGKWTYTGRKCSSCGEIIVESKHFTPNPEEPTTND